MFQTFQIGFSDVFQTDHIILKEIGTTVQTRNRSIQEIYVSLETNSDFSPWEPFGSWLSFTHFRIKAGTTFNGGQNWIIGSTDVEVYETPMQVTIELPSRSFNVMLKKGHTVNLLEHVEQEMNIQVPGMSEITCTEFMMNGLVPSGYYSIHVALENVWNVEFGGISISIDDLEMDFERSNEGNGAYLGGHVTICDEQFFLSASKEIGDNYWEFYGATADQANISLSSIISKFASWIGAGPVSFPHFDVTIKQGRIAFNNGPNKNIMFHAITEVVVPVFFLGAEKHLDVTVHLDSSIQNGERVYKGYFKAEQEVGDGIFELRFDIDRSPSKITGSWIGKTESSTLKLEDIGAFLGIDHDIDDGKNTDLGLTAISLSYDVTRKQFTLSGTSESYGSAFVTAGKDSTGGFGLIFGVNLDTDKEFSELPHSQPGFDIIDFIDFKQSSILLIKGKFDNYKLPTPSYLYFRCRKSTTSTSCSKCGDGSPNRCRFRFDHGYL